jgi:hypothetical protein
LLWPAAFYLPSESALLPFWPTVMLTKLLIILWILEKLPPSRPPGSKRAARLAAQEQAQFSTGASDD